MKNKILSPIYIEWIDSHGVTSGWIDLNDFMPDMPIMKSIGFIVYEDKDKISVCGNVGEETKSTLFQGNGIMTIPKNCIVRRKKLNI